MTKVILSKIKVKNSEDYGMMVFVSIKKCDLIIEWRRRYER